MMGPDDPIQRQPEELWPHEMQELKALALAQIDTDGQVLAANLGFWSAFHLHAPESAGLSVAARFIQPTFADLCKLAADSPGCDGEAVFRGVLNVGTPGTVPTSLNGTVYQRGKILLLVAEHDIEHADRLRTSVLSLNQELAETQRQLVRDLQERKRIQRELEANYQTINSLYQELSQRAEALFKTGEAKSKFISYLSHEFRTPLTAIQQLTLLLLHGVDGPITTEQAKQLKLVHNASRTLFQMSEDLLDIAKIEAGQVQVRAERLSIGDLFARVQAMMQFTRQSSDVPLVIELPSPDVFVHSDEVKIAQILRNFISNALKFTRHGEVRVRAKCVEEGRCLIEVKDTGIGITPEDQGRLFHDFVQVGERVRTHPKNVGNGVDQAPAGTGLGLALSRQLAGLLGGKVGVLSHVNQGSTFFLELPLRYRENVS